MVNDITVKVKLEVDEGSKQSVRNQAQAIRDTGQAPVSGQSGQSFRGGIFGDTEDPDVKGFEKRQSIGGGVERLRDRTSAAPVDLRSSFQKAKDEQKAIKEQLRAQQQELSQLRSILSSPQGQIESRVLDFISSNPNGKAVLAFVPVVGAALASPEIVYQIIQVLIAPGGPFDRRLRIILEEQEEQFLSREAQKRRELGLDQVVISQTGYGNANGRLTTNTLEQVKQAGISDIGLNETGIGMR